MQILKFHNYKNNLIKVSIIIITIISDKKKKKGGDGQNTFLGVFTIILLYFHIIVINNIVSSDKIKFNIKIYLIGEFAYIHGVIETIH